MGSQLEIQINESRRSRKRHQKGRREAGVQKSKDLKREENNRPGHPRRGKIKKSSERGESEEARKSGGEQRAGPRIHRERSTRKKEKAEFWNPGERRRHPRRVSLWLLWYKVLWRVNGKESPPKSSADEKEGARSNSDQRQRRSERL